MNCRNCGAAMELVGGRDYFFCRHCGSFQFPESATDGVRVLTRESGPGPCGVCKRPLAAAVLKEGVHVKYCEHCRGVLLARADFAATVDRLRAWVATPPVAPGPIDKRGLGRSMTCPACSRGMATHPYYGPGNVIIDTCEGCNLVWLDFGELRQIVDAPGKDRGRGERLPRDAASGDDIDLFAIFAGRLDREGESG